MDAKVRVNHAEGSPTAMGSSHTGHTVHAAGASSSTLVAPTQSHRYRLIAATVEALAEGSVDRLRESRDAAKAL